MHMIFHAAYDHGFEALIAGNSGHVCPEFGLQCLRDAFMSFLGAEDYMNPVA
jgi:hypothetical protein